MPKTLKQFEFERKKISQADKETFKLWLLAQREKPAIWVKTGENEETNIRALVLKELLEELA